MSGINLVSPTSFTSAVLIADTVAAPGGSNDSISTMTKSGGVTVSAALEIQSTTGALLVPRMTTTQRDAIVTPYNGMILYDTTTDLLNIRVGGAWQTTGGGGGPVSGPASSTDNAIARWNGTGGDDLENSVPTIADTTGAIATGPGTVNLPTYTFLTRTKCGMWSSSDNTVDFSTNELRAFQIAPAPALSVNYLVVTPQAANSGLTVTQPKLAAAGADTHIDLAVQAKGTAGFAILPSTSGVAATARFWNGAGTFYTSLAAGVNAANLALTLPIVDATANAAATATASAAALATNAAGATTFSSTLPRYTRVTLDTAAVTGMAATSVEIIAAPGAGNSILVHTAMVELDFGGTNFANGGDVSLFYGASIAAIANIATADIAAAFVNGGADASISVTGEMVGTTGLAKTLTSNLPLMIGNDTGAFDTGNGALVVHVWYSIVATV